MQTRMRFVPPLTGTCTVCRFGSNRRGDTLCAWLTLRPTTGPLPQISQRFAMADHLASPGPDSRPDRPGRKLLS